MSLLTATGAILASGLVASAAGPLPFSLTISPAKLAGNVNHVSLIRVSDTGKTDELIAPDFTQLIRTNGVCHLDGNPSYVQLLNQPQFWLKPGEEHTVRILIKPTSPGKHSVAVEMITQLGHKGEVRLSAAVAAGMLVTIPGHVDHASKPCITLPMAAKPASNDTPIIAGAIAFLVLVMTAVYGIIRHRRQAI